MGCPLLKRQPSMRALRTKSPFLSPVLVTVCVQVLHMIENVTVMKSFNCAIASVPLKVFLLFPTSKVYLIQSAMSTTFLNFSSSIL